MRATFFALACIIALDISAQQPNLKVVWPLYGINTMNLQWDPVPMAAEYQARVRVNGGAYSGWVSAGTSTNWNHPTNINAMDTFTYQVRVRVGANWIDTSAERSNRMVKMWPVANSNASCNTESVEVLNGFNQPIFAGGTHYLHEGMDIHGEENIASECVRAPMGGVITTAGGTGSNIVVNMTVYMNGQTENIQFNHLDNLNPALVVGESVQPGERLGDINGGVASWNTQTSHTHCHYWINSANFFGTTRDPHLIFDDNSHRDPQQINPRVGNTNSDSDSLRFRKGPDQSDYFMKDTVYKEADIVVEAFDPQSADAPWAAPKLTGYYIQKFDGTNWVDAVKSSGTPYVLTDNVQGFYQSSGGSPIPAVNNAISDRAAALESGPPVTPNFYVWDQWWTYIVTNTNGTNGAAVNLDANECWATDARNTVAQDNGYAMNYDRARSIDEAKFPDGKYRAHIRLRDYVNSPADYQRIVFVDNFRPYVKEAKIESGDLNYMANWNWNAGGGQLEFNPNTDMDSVCGEVKIMITASESMKDMNINIPTLSFSKNATSSVAGSNDKMWEFTVPSSVIENNEDSGPHVIHIDGHDLNGNPIQGFPGTGNMAGASIPKKQHNGGWMPSTAPFPDTLHKFNIATVAMELTLDTEGVTCPGDSDGKITVTVDGGMAPYMYSKDDGATYQSSNVFENLAEGTYTIKVKDDKNCVVSEEATVDPSDLTLSVSGGGFFQFCVQDGPPDITLTASASGGTPPYNYSWAGGSLTVSSSGVYTVNVTDDNGCMKSASAVVILIPIVCSRDPNDIIGPEGYAESRWISVNDNLPYTIRFENDPEFATAPAQKVTVEHFPDSSLNLFSLRLGDFGFANMIFEVPENSTFYSQRLDVTDSLGVLVDVTAGIDVTANKIFWIFESIDPLTGLAPSDPFAGMLPVNDTLTHRGEGFVNFTMKPKPGSVTGDSVSAQAVIVFDINPPIETNIWTNIIDAVPPVSALNPLPDNSDTTAFVVEWTGMDDTTAVGVSHYELYVSHNGAPFALHQSNIDTTALEFTGAEGSEYAFFVRAIDNVGNKEPLKGVGEDTISVKKELLVNPIIYLGGAYDTLSSLMRDDLRAGGHLPLDEPYTALGYTHVGGGEESTTQTVFNVATADAVVDWVFLELRDKADSTLVVATRSALLQRDGDVVDVDGISPVGFANLEEGEYYFVLKHRNHLGVMSAAPIALSRAATVLDFTADIGNTFGGINGIATMSDGNLSLYSGDFDRNGQVQNTDYAAMVLTLGTAGYLQGDLDLNGQVQNTDVQFRLIPNIGKGQQFP